jgi:hypothetical protein
MSKTKNKRGRPTAVTELLRRLARDENVSGPVRQGAIDRLANIDGLYTVVLKAPLTPNPEGTGGFQEKLSDTALTPTKPEESIESRLLRLKNS